MNLDALVEGVLAGRRAEIGRAITLVESRQVDHFDAAAELLDAGDACAGARFRKGELIEAHGGSLKIESEHNVGTRVAVRLPLTGN